MAGNNYDAEEDSGGSVQLSNSKLELGAKTWVGFNFQNVNVPQGATITAAYVQFKAADNNTETTHLTIFGQDIDSAAVFSSSSNNLSARTRTSASVTWNNVSSWSNDEIYDSPDISAIVQEIVDRAGWTTTSEMAILIRSDLATGKRMPDAYEGSTTGAALLHIEYATSTTPDPVSDQLYVQRTSTITPATTGAWTTIDISVPPYNVPAGKVAEIAVANGDTSNERLGGVRAVGSSLTRCFNIHEAEGGGIDAVTMHVQANSSGQIQYYAETTSVSFKILGYWNCGTYVERMDAITASSASTWQDRNLNSYGVGANQIAEIVMANGATGNERTAGVRKKGSSLTRSFLIQEAHDGGIDAATLFVQAGTNSNATIQVYTSSTTDITFYLVGYWARPPGKFTEAMSDVGVPSSENSWLDKSLSSSGVPAEGVAEIMLENEEGSMNTLGVRKNGTTSDRRLSLRKVSGGGSDFLRLHATTDASTLIEWHTPDNDPNHMGMHVAGYWKPAPGEVLMVVADKTSPTTGELARLTLLEGWDYTVNLIDDDDSQTTYNTAFLYNSAVYVPEVVADASVGSKLNATQLGIVFEESLLADDYGFATGATTSSGTTITVTDATHYITSSFSPGSVTIFSSSQSRVELTGTTPLQLQSLAEVGSAKSLVALEANAQRSDGTYVASRRVQLPWGGSGFDFSALNSNGQTILKRSLEWASALKGWWRLDESSGTSASDSSSYLNSATLGGGANFSTHGVATAQVLRGLDLDGLSYLTVSSSASLEIETAITISAWIKPDGLASAYLVDKGSTSSYYFKTNSNGSLTLGSTTAAWEVTSAAGTITAGTWQHVTGTYNSATGVGVLYVNGIAIKTQTSLTGTVGVSGSNLVIGADNATTGSRFAGLIDDVRVYSQALSANEALALKRSGRPAGIRILTWVEVQ